MSAPSGSRGSRGFRPSTRARGNHTSRGSQARSEDAVRQTRPLLGTNNGVASKQVQPSSRGAATRGPSRRGTARGTPLYPAASRQTRNTSNSAMSHLRRDASRDATTQEPAAYRAFMEKAFRTLEEQRKQERKDAIRDGLLADPDKPTTLANAITIIGTCQGMCAEHERVQRITQFMVDDCEKVPHATKEGVKVPSEDRMVKRYRRPAAGYEEQLPSDIRPPLMLQKTLDYLMDEVVGGSEPLANVHKFVWDRTRAIRNDFSIQQVTKVDELRIAISCFERIARFHILSLHQLARAGENGVDFDAYQEREQLNNTLLSLMYYYDDSRHKLVSPNEPEFRAYCIVFEIQDQRPDLEDRAQNWPPAILEDRRVQVAMKLYAAATNTSEAQGPLRPQVSNAIAQANTPRFFDIIQSPAVPYLMACVAEIYFNKVRRTALDTIWKAYRVKRGGSARFDDWTLPDLTQVLGFDDEHETQAYCEDHGFTVTEKDNGEACVDLGSVAGRYLSDANSNRKQAFATNLVEHKRHSRTLPAVINGFTAAQAQAQGSVVEEYTDNENASTANDESLFLPDGVDTTEPPKESTDDSKKPDLPQAEEEPNDTASNKSTVTQLSSTPLTISGEPKPNPLGSTTFFGKPSISSQPPSDIQPFTPQTNLSKPATSNPFNTQEQLAFSTSPFSNLGKTDSKPPTFDFAKPTTSPAQSNTTQSNSPSSSPFSFKPSSTIESPKFSFGISSETNQIRASDASPHEDKAKSIEPPPGPSNSIAEESTGSKQKTSTSPFAFLNPTPKTTSIPPSTLFPRATVTSPIQNPNLPISQAPVLSFSPQSPFPNAPSEPAQEKLSSPVSKSGFSLAQPTSLFPARSPSASNVVNESSALTSPRSIPNATIVINNTPPTNLSARPESRSSPASISELAGIDAPNPRPAVLDALAEGLLMEDQGLLQQFIEYTIGPIVSKAFREVEEEKSWKSAREVRSTILSRKFCRRWKDIVWKRKLMRKGKERRAIFAKSMQEMAKSSHRGHSQSKASSQSSLREDILDLNEVNQVEISMPPPLQSKNLKRKSLPTDFEGEKVPNAESSNGIKRKRRDLSQTKGSKESINTSLKPHHKRSRTMGDSQNNASFYDNLADFSQLNETGYANEKVIRQARRLIGNSKLDTTRGDYFALKARGVNPDIVFTPPQSGLKRSRVDEQIERVRKLLKPSQPDPKKTSKQSHTPNDLATHGNQTSLVLEGSSADNLQISPNDLLAQVRQVREALAEGTTWFQTEREKSERLSSSRSSEATRRPSIGQIPSQSTQIQPADRRPHGRNPTPTRAQIRLGKTKANGLLPPDWDWNKSVTEWKLRGGMGSPRPGASREPSERSTPAATSKPQQQQTKKPTGLAAATNGLGQRKERTKVESEVVYNDDDDEEEEVEEDEETDEDDTGEDYKDGPDGQDEEEGYEDGYGEEYEEEFEDEYEDEEEEDDVPPARAVLKAQGNSADSAIDLD